uniref:CCHC-type domain-containing protein n=1 Tax=Ananas comosus var. bracteatus TaxID=296719 RepID=A0A6V7QLT3_ANACO|nr:unnamed protein product [Ananas comosus var. bracteatus]
MARSRERRRTNVEASAVVQGLRRLEEQLAALAGLVQQVVQQQAAAGVEQAPPSGPDASIAANNVADVACEAVIGPPGDQVTGVISVTDGPRSTSATGVLPYTTTSTVSAEDVDSLTVELAHVGGSLAEFTIGNPLKPSDERVDLVLKGSSSEKAFGKRPRSNVEGRSSSNTKPPKHPRTQAFVKNETVVRKLRGDRPCVICGQAHRVTSCPRCRDHCYRCGQPGHLRRDCLGGYDLSIQYHPGKANVVADALSWKQPLAELSFMITSQDRLVEVFRRLEIEGLQRLEEQLAALAGLVQQVVQQQAAAGVEQAPPSGPDASIAANNVADVACEAVIGPPGDQVTGVISVTDGPRSTSATCILPYTTTSTVSAEDVDSLTVELARVGGSLAEFTIGNPLKPSDERVDLVLKGSSSKKHSESGLVRMCRVGHRATLNHPSILELKHLLRMKLLLECFEVIDLA